MYFNVWTESNRKKRGLDFISGCGDTIESLVNYLLLLIILERPFPLNQLSYI